MGRRSTATNADAEESLEQPTTAMNQSKAVEASHVKRSAIAKRQMAINPRSAKARPIGQSLRLLHLPPLGRLKTAKNYIESTAGVNPTFRLTRQVMSPFLPKAIAAAL